LKNDKFLSKLVVFHGRGRRARSCFATPLAVPEIRFFALARRISTAALRYARCFRHRRRSRPHPARGFGGEKLRGEKSFVYGVYWTFGSPCHKLCHNTLDKIGTHRKNSTNTKKHFVYYSRLHYGDGCVCVFNILRLFVWIEENIFIRYEMLIIFTVIKANVEVKFDIFNYIFTIII